MAAWIRKLLLPLCIGLCVGGFVQAQEPAPETGVDIIWPPPVTEVFFEGSVIGTANVPNMAYYYLEYMPLNTDLSIPDTVPWIPATVALTQPVSNGPLAALNTRTVEDGLYALRLTVVTNDGFVYNDVVTPLRVSNSRFDAFLERIQNETGPEPTPAPAEPTPVPTEAPVDNTPRVAPDTGLAAVNIRNCDVIDNYACLVINALRSGEVGRVTAVSARNPGWYQVVLPGGAVGWVSDTVVLKAGDFSTLPAIFPPEPLPPPPPPGNVVPTGMEIVGGVATCNVPYSVNVNMGNVGITTSEAGQVSLQAVNLRTGDVTFTGISAYPALNPGANYVVVFNVTETTFYNEGHELRARAGGQEFRLGYTLQQGSCGAVVIPTAEPPPVVTNPGRDLLPNQCFVVLTNVRVIFDTPYGNPQGRLDPAPYEAARVEISNNATWYRLDRTSVGRPVWISASGTETQGNCGL